MMISMRAGQGFVLAALVVSAVVGQAPNTERPNFIVVMTDDQGWGDARYNGHEEIQTPHLDAMSRAGIRFDRFYATASMCSPTRAATLTGRSNLRLGIGGPIAAGRGHLAAEEITIAEALEPKGYVSGHFGKWHVGDIVNDADQTHVMHPGMAGFGEWFSTRNVLPTLDPYRGKFDKSQHYYHNGRYVPESEGITGDDSKIVMDAAVRFFCARAVAGGPFFAFICFHAVHKPLGLIEDFALPYASVEDKNRRIYYSNITAIDAAMGSLRSRLRELGIAENSLLLFCSDNGPNLKGEEGAGPGSKGPFRGRKGQLYEGGILVPGLLEWPAVVGEGRVVDTPVITSDLFPTFLELASVELPDRPYDGVSIASLIRGDGSLPERDLCFSAKGWLAIQSRGRKLVRQKGRSAAFQLYDLTADPCEKTDLASDQPAVVSELRGKLDAWVKACEESQSGADYR